MTKLNAPLFLEKPVGVSNVLVIGTMDSGNREFFELTNASSLLLPATIPLNNFWAWKINLGHFLQNLISNVDQLRDAGIQYHFTDHDGKLMHAIIVPSEDWAEKIKVVVHQIMSFNSKVSKLLWGAINAVGDEGQRDFIKWFSREYKHRELLETFITNIKQSESDFSDAFLTALVKDYYLVFVAAADSYQRKYNPQRSVLNELLSFAH